MLQKKFELEKAYDAIKKLVEENNIRFVFAREYYAEQRRREQFLRESEQLLEVFRDYLSRTSQLDMTVLKSRKDCKKNL